MGFVSEARAHNFFTDVVVELAVGDVVFDDVVQEPGLRRSVRKRGTYPLMGRDKIEELFRHLVDLHVGVVNHDAVGVRRVGVEVINNQILPFVKHEVTSKDLFFVEGVNHHVVSLEELDRQLEHV